MDREPKVQIFKSEPINNPHAPFVTSFSSRGHGRFMADIIKVRTFFQYIHREAENS